MYLTFYGLNKEPFHITPDPEFLYLSPSHKEALASIIYGIEQRKGFVAIVGAVGVGKTTILRSYLETADRKHLKIIYIFNARLSFEGLLRTIYQELGLTIEKSDVVELVNNLYQYLIDEYKQGNNVILVVDEAQNMPIETLENLRMLSNLETSKDKLIQIVLVGQPEFEEGLNLTRLRQLKQRLAIRSTILPLSKRESLDYIRHRLAKAGAGKVPIFTKGALSKIVDHARGIPRVINVLGDNALVTGFGYQRKPVTGKIVREVITDFRGHRRPLPLRWYVAFPLLLLFLGMTVLAAVSRWPNVLYREGIFNSLRESPVVSQEVAPPHESLLRGRVEEEAALPKQIHTPEPRDSSERRLIEKGDTLTRLAEHVYGHSDAALIKLIQENNRQITDPDKILAGSTIVFPQVERK
jgi:general secretion pathway protein A